jgi:hypothetical protein
MNLSNTPNDPKLREQLRASRWLLPQTYRDSHRAALRCL